MQKKKKKITLNGLGGTVGSLSVKMDRLASAIEVGFKRMDKGFKDAKEDNESLARMVASGFEHTNNDISDVRDSVTRLEQGQENILLRLDGMTPKFEAKEQERRIKRLEDKTGIRHTL